MVKNLHAEDSRHYRVSSLCTLFGVTKQAYYKYDETRLLERIASVDFAVSYIKDTRKKDLGIGGMKLWYMYRKSFEDNNPLAPNRLWVSDITYITIWVDAEHYRFCYLSLVLDACSEEIVGWCVGETLDAEYPLKALEMALHRIGGTPKEDVCLIHHSDRGCQYASSRYVATLKAHGIRASKSKAKHLCNP